MKKITKDALEILKKLNPYSGEYAEAESYNELYEAMRILKSFGLIPDEDFNKIHEMDHNEFMNAQ